MNFEFDASRNVFLRFNMFCIHPPKVQSRKSQKLVSKLYIQPLLLFFITN